MNRRIDFFLWLGIKNIPAGYQFGLKIRADRHIKGHDAILNR